MHLTFKFYEDRPVVEKGVRKQAVQPAHYLEQVFCGAGRNGDARSEVVVVLDDGSRMVERVDHVVDGRAFLRRLVRSAEELGISGDHFGAALARADA